VVLKVIMMIFICGNHWTRGTVVFFDLFKNV